MVSNIINANPTLYQKKDRRARNSRKDVDEYASEPIDALEIFDAICPYAVQAVSIPTDHLRDIKDPEHPYSLEELNVITEDAIEVDDKRSYVRVTFTPTVQHCNQAVVIGLCLRVKLLRCLPSRFQVVIRLAPGSHSSEDEVNKQVNDKERVAAAMENINLSTLIEWK